MGSLRDDLQEMAGELEETHISWVVLRPHEVFKVKKPVSLGFLDFTTTAQRLAACKAEVALNRRLAPEVYRDVVPVTRDATGRHQLGGKGEAVDWAVHMRRMPIGDRADRRLAEGRLDRAHLDGLARRLAIFHAEARRDEETARHGTARAVGVNVRENFEQTRDAIHRFLQPQEAREIEARQMAFLDDNATLFAQRIRDGRVCDGHGDLRLEHVYFDDRDTVTVLDCIEFNERFRCADVCADVAFLAMDLTWHQQADLAEGFLASYARHANDFDLYALVDFYESYRAYVRGKIASLMASAEASGPVARERAEQEARRYFLLALAAERRPLLPPVVVAVGGIIAAGKSTVAQEVAAPLTAPIVASDPTRKHLLDVAPTEPVHDPAFDGAYSEALTDQVYEEMMRRAAVVLASGRPVIFDASFRSQGSRQQARALAARFDVPFYFIECQVAPAVARQRLRRRAEERSVSDGRLEIFEDFRQRWQPVRTLSPDEHLVLDTGLPLRSNLATLRQHLPVWPRGLS